MFCLHGDVMHILWSKVFGEFLNSLAIASAVVSLKNVLYKYMTHCADEMSPLYYLKAALVDLFFNEPRLTPPRPLP